LQSQGLAKEQKLNGRLDNVNSKVIENGLRPHTERLPIQRTELTFSGEVSRPSPNQDERPATRSFLCDFDRDRPGMRFDVLGCGSRRINGVRNFRQALASPHPAVRFTSRRGLLLRFL
jgi:hypothetical protein